MVELVYAGRTRAGKPVYYPFDSETEEKDSVYKFESLDDNFDAYAIFYYLFDQSKKEATLKEVRAIFQRRLLIFQNRIDVTTSIRECMNALEIGDETELLEFGKQLVLKL